MTKTAARTAAPIIALLALGLSACHQAAMEPGGSAAAASQAIGPEETIRLAGTEPFWGGTIAAGRLTLTTPENPSGETVEVRRFAGLKGLGFSGSLGAQAVDVVITELPCSDGMSDRRYPFSVVLRAGQSERAGCAWTDRTPYSEGKADVPGREPTSGR